MIIKRIEIRQIGKIVFIIITVAAVRACNGYENSINMELNYDGRFNRFKCLDI